MDNIEVSNVAHPKYTVILIKGESSKQGGGGPWMLTPLMID